MGLANKMVANPIFWLAILTKALGVLMHVRANEVVAHCYMLACV